MDTEENNTFTIYTETSFVKRFLFLWKRNREISVGVSRSEKGERFVIVGKNTGDERSIILASGKSLQKCWIRFFYNEINTSLQSITYMQSVVKDENRHITAEDFLPHGGDIKEFACEYVVEEERGYGASLKYSHLNDEISGLVDEGYVVNSLTPQYFALGKLYYDIIKRSFILWYVREQNSTLVVMEGQYPSAAVTISIQEYGLHEDEGKEKIKTLFTQLKKQYSINDVYVVKENGQLFLDESDYGITLQECSSFGGLSMDYHDALALALVPKTVCNFAPPEEIGRSLSIVQNEQLLMRWVRYCTLFLGSVTLLLLMSGGILLGTEHLLNEKISPYTPHIKRIEVGEKKLRTAQKHYKEKFAFYHRESALTNLLNDLQSVYMTGVYSESIEIHEHSEKQWKIITRGITRSSSLIPRIIGKIENIPGSESVRLVYSERKKEKETVVGLLFNIEFLWSPQERSQ